MRRNFRVSSALFLILMMAMVLMVVSCKKAKVVEKPLEGGTDKTAAQDIAAMPGRVLRLARICQR